MSTLFIHVPILKVQNTDFAYLITLPTTSLPVAIAMLFSSLFTIFWAALFSSGLENRKKELISNKFENVNKEKLGNIFDILTLSRLV